VSSAADANFVSDDLEQGLHGPDAVASEITAFSKLCVVAAAASSGDDKNPPPPPPLPLSEFLELVSHGEGAEASHLVVSCSSGA
jgi:hypothetical protein